MTAPVTDPPALAWHAVSFPERVAAIRQAKAERAATHLGRPPRTLSAPDPAGDRTRVDLMWWRGALGVRGPAGDGGEFPFEPVRDPGVADRSIRVALVEFVASRPPFDMAQVRFRADPAGRIGLWIDLSRAGITALAADPAWARPFLDRGWMIEVGQRGEALSAGARAPVPATPHDWLPAVDAAGRDVPLRLSVASFSQPGPRANRGLVAALGQLLAGEPLDGWCDVGSGYGNLVPFLAGRAGGRGTALEGDARAFRLLAANGDRFFPGVRLERATAERLPDEPAGDAPSLWLLDPPRPGFPALLERLAERTRPPALILACHCHERGLAGDAGRLRRGGYLLEDWIGVDLFPGSPHLEVVSLWRRGAC